MAGPNWDRRIERASELEASLPFAAPLLRLYRELAGLQKSVYQAAEPLRGNSSGLPAELDLEFLLQWAEEFLQIVERAGTPTLAEGAREVYERKLLGELLAAWWSGEELGDTEAFFARVLLEPYAEALAAGAPGAQDYQRSVCPVCGRKPLVGVLRAEGYGARRSFLCSLCASEWDYPRITCPNCGEQEFEKLAVYTTGEFPHVRVEACDTCRCYMKTIDLTKDGLAVPVVEDLATIPLNLWAEEKGYRKLQKNLLGI